jgi:uncharacterized membrane protein YedE/YeeE
VAFIDTFLDRDRTTRITREARDIHFWRTVLAVLAGVLFGLGWVVAKVFGVAWLALTWTATAVRLGWQEGRKPARAT